jgi:thiol-disulfide isomerase/thioredoxin
MPFPRKNSGRILLVLLCLAVGFGWFAPGVAKGNGGRHGQVYELEFEDINPRSETHGELLPLSRLYAEGGVVMQFTASWCKFCREDLPMMQEYYDRGDVPMVFVAADEGPMRENILTIAERVGLTAPLFFVPEDQAETVSTHYPYQVLPATYFIDGRGRIVGQHQGEISMQRLMQEVEAMKRLNPPTP